MKPATAARVLAAIGVTVAVALAGATAGSASNGTAAKVRGDATVLAASSLTEAFAQIGADFEQANPQTTITFSFNASSTLSAQIQQGVPADVFASADEASVERLGMFGWVTTQPTVFARNRLAIAVAPGNPENIETLAGTVDPDVTLVLRAAEVPCGKFALEAYANAGVDVPAVPYAANVKDALSKVAIGEADAAIVYATDVEAANGAVEGVKIPKADNVIAVYPAAPIAGSESPSVAKAFVKYLVSEQGQATLKRFGFLPA